jgi:uncharacterized protein YeaO (DUF488 family)
MGELDTQSLMSEIDTQSYMPGGNDSKKSLRDAELWALEAEVFGGRFAQEQTKYALGAWYENAEHGKQSYEIVSATGGGISVPELGNLRNCLYGVPYSLATDDNCFFFRENISYGDIGWTLVIHSTHNKDNRLAACSISVFHGTNTFLAYLFTTNDPLNFDNFNTYRGNGTAVVPQYKCVEQLVFCECKILLGLALAQNLSNPQEELFQFALNTPYIPEPIIDTLKGSIMDFLNTEQLETLDGIKAQFVPEITILSAEIKSGTLDEQTNRTKKARKSQLENQMNTLLAVKVREYIGSLGAVNFYNGYVRYFTNKLSVTHLAQPKDHYKFAGRGVLGVNGFLDKWEEIQLMCAVSARMKQLSSCKQERDLCAALVPRCILEISDQDNIWGYSNGKKLDWFCNAEGKSTLVNFIEDARKFQDAFISEFNRISHNKDEALNLLFSSSKQLKTKFSVDSIHTLGLSERLIQSIWTKQIVFSDELKRAISDKLAAYRITYDHYEPELIPRRRTAFETVSAIGRRSK